MNAIETPPMTVYHGSNVLFDKIDLSLSRDRRDFGRGFYTTTVYEQACAWARNMRLRYGGGQHVYVYRFEPDDALRVKRFEGLTVEWLDTVKANRQFGGLRHDCDVMIGPVANDNTMRTIALYVSGIYTADMALQQLRFAKANDQVSFHTENALRALRFTRRIDL